MLTLLLLFVAGLWGIVNKAGVSSDICPIEFFVREDYAKVYEVSPIIHTYNWVIIATYTTTVDDEGLSCMAANNSEGQLF